MHLKSLCKLSCAVAVFSMDLGSLESMGDVSFMPVERLSSIVVARSTPFGMLMVDVMVFSITSNTLFFFCFWIRSSHRWAVGNLQSIPSLMPVSYMVSCVYPCYPHAHAETLGNWCSLYLTRIQCFLSALYFGLVIVTPASNGLSISDTIILISIYRYASALL